MKGKHILLGVTGGIAAYRACDLARRLTKQGAAVDVMMTRAATEFVAPLTFESLTHRTVVWDQFARPERRDIEHIAWAKRADVCVIAPATANCMGKLASGIADDFLTTTAMATQAPLLLAPAMNTGMWTNAATRENYRVLCERGVKFVGPISGLLACNDVGQGRMAELDDIYNAIAEILGPRDLVGKTLLVTAGPTREDIDPVRYISNRSSGKMGYAICQAALERGAAVILVTGPTSLEPPAGAKVVQVGTTQQMHDAVMQHLPEADAAIMAAAPADFTAQTRDEKLPKADSLNMTLTATPDIAAAVGRQKGGRKLIIFAAQTSADHELGRKKLAAKGADWCVFNNVAQPGAGFDADTNIAAILGADGSVIDCPLMQKSELAQRILDLIV